MKNIIVCLTFLLTLGGCQTKITDTDLVNLNGYWEIEKVTKPDGSKKEYKVNETIDFFELKNKNGIRKKVTPQFNGTYLVNNQSEAITITQKNGETFINYVTSYAQWKERMVSLTKDILVIVNDQNIEYQYKKFTPFSIK